MNDQFEEQSAQVQEGRILFTKDPANYDPDMSPLEILKKYESGEYDKEDLLSHMYASAVASDKKLEIIAERKARERMAAEAMKVHHIKT